MKHQAYGPVGTGILMTTDDLTVWEVNVPAGEHLAMHHHRHPYLVVHTTNGHIRVAELDGQVREREVTNGLVEWHPVGEIHELVNIGDQPYTNVLIELKGSVDEFHE